MRPINVSLDSVTWELAKAKPNFSQWVRDQLRSEDNKRKESQQRRKNNTKECILQCGRPRFSNDMYCLHHIEQGHSQEAMN
jgi:hypothetical protein